MNYNTIQSLETGEKTAKALTANGFNATIVTNGEEAKKKILGMIPEGSEVFTYTSKTLDTIGITSEINESGKYNSVRNALYSDQKKEGRDINKTGAAPQFALGSVHAVTQNGTMIVASATGSQLPAYAYGAETVIFVIGMQKIVTDFEDGMKRLEEHVFPLENERAKVAYGSGSVIAKILILNKEVNTKRIHVILVNEALGF